MKKYDVVALGELLVDFTMNGSSKQGNPLFEANPGGAPCNVLSMLQKLGRQTAFIGKTGRDSFGEMLRNVVAEQGIDTRNLIMDGEVPTTLAFVHTAPDGDRSFSFYRKPAADMMLRAEEIDCSLLEHTKIFHFGSLSMTDSGVERATKKAVRMAKESGALISFDPNLRPPLWENLDVAKEKIAYGISQCQILKISDDEIAFFTGMADIGSGVEKIREQYGTPVIFATMGKNGSRVYHDGNTVECPPFLNADTIDTTGAGDTFMACALHYILEFGLDGLDEQKLYDMLEFANAASSIVTTKKGALKVMPEEADVRALYRKGKGEERSLKQNEIIIEGARIHNLQGIDVTIPKQKLTVITGVSGSGKSSLAFDTLYEEGKRRYLLFSGTQFMIDSVPSFNAITGLSPTVAVEQRTIRQANPRSTVGTRMKLSPMLAALYANYGRCDEEYDDGLPLDVSMFQRNSAKGMCVRCLGKGVAHFLDEVSLFADKEQKIVEIACGLGKRADTKKLLAPFCEKYGIDMWNDRICDLTKKQLQLIKYGDGGKSKFCGFIPWITMLANTIFPEKQVVAVVQAAPTPSGKAYDDMVSEIVGRFFVSLTFRCTFIPDYAIL